MPIPLTGQLEPNNPNDTYPITDAQWELDGLRNVPDYAARNAITTQRRRAGMVVGVQSDATYWRLLPGPWDGSDADWTPFAASGGGATGIQGVTGIWGSTGVVGATGVGGVPGNDGLAGATGPQGARGATGVQGLPGSSISGPQGVTGVDGPTGPLGLPGPLGATGIQGVAGSPGLAGLTGVAGTTGAGGLAGIQGIQGITGATGVQGLQGIQGTTGVDGQTGVQGLPGIQGITGATGVQGLQGIQGITGATGVQGLQGIQGVTGATGVQGLQGIQGITGAVGLQGITGATGVQGLQGIQGVTGATGVQGLQGIQGATGVQGIQGITGATGVQGIQGNTGVQGQTGIQRTYSVLSKTAGYTMVADDYLVLVDGTGGTFTINLPLAPPDGSQYVVQRTDAGGTTTRIAVQSGDLWYDGGGPANYRSLTGQWAMMGFIYDAALSTYYLNSQVGARGFTGIQGIQGITGATGIQGIIGATGVQGATGAGPQGITGATGVQGIQGIQGITGATGVQGLQGITGLRGITGPSGGVQGVTGATGVQGIQGVTGIWGSTGAGIQGITGLRGITGPSGGVQGVTGATGVQGIQGATGVGAQGITGVIGATGVQGIVTVSGATGLLQFALGSALSSDANLKWDHVSDNLLVGSGSLGIGTAPSYRLDILNNGAVTAANIYTSYVTAADTSSVQVTGAGDGSTSHQVYGLVATASGAGASYVNYGLSGVANSTTGQNIGVNAQASGGTSKTNYGLYSTASNSSTVNYAGYFLTGTGSSDLAILTSGGVSVAGNRDVVQMVVKASASQAAHLQEWQNSSGTPLAWIGPQGNYNTTGLVSCARGAVTSSDGTLSTSATWNNGAVAFTHWSASVTNTASLTSYLLGMQVGGANMVWVRYDGAMFLAGGLGVNGTTPPAKAAAPATLTDVITILRNMGFCS